MCVCVCVCVFLGKKDITGCLWIVKEFTQVLRALGGFNDLCADVTAWSKKTHEETGRRGRGGGGGEETDTDNERQITDAFLRKLNTHTCAFLHSALGQRGTKYHSTRA